MRSSDFAVLNNSACPRQVYPHGSSLERFELLSETRQLLAFRLETHVASVALAKG